MTMKAVIEMLFLDLNVLFMSRFLFIEEMPLKVKVANSVDCRFLHNANRASEAQKVRVVFVFNGNSNTENIYF